MARKGPDGRTLPVGKDDEEKDTTRRMARRSIRDRIASADDANGGGNGGGDGDGAPAVHRPVDSEVTAPGGEASPPPADVGNYEETRLAGGAGPQGVAQAPTQPMAPVDVPPPVAEATADPAGAPGTPGSPPPGAPADAEVTQVYRPNRN